MAHDSVVCECDDRLKRQLQKHHKRETRDSVGTVTRYRSLFDVRSGANVELDVALSHPRASDILNQTGEKDGAAAARRDERKTMAL